MAALVPACVLQGPRWADMTDTDTDDDIAVGTMMKPRDGDGSNIGAVAGSRRPQPGHAWLGAATPVCGRQRDGVHAAEVDVPRERVRAAATTAPPPAFLTMLAVTLEQKLQRPAAAALAPSPEWCPRPREQPLRRARVRQQRAATQQPVRPFLAHTSRKSAYLPRYEPRLPKTPVIPPTVWYVPAGRGPGEAHGTESDNDADDGTSSDTELAATAVRACLKARLSRDAAPYVPRHPR